MQMISNKQETSFHHLWLFFLSSLIVNIINSHERLVNIQKEKNI